MSKPSEARYTQTVLEGQRGALTGLDRNVKVLGLVTLLNDLSSEVTVRTLPLFLANVLGVKTGVIGFIEGIAEVTPEQHRGRAFGFNKTMDGDK